MLVAPRREGDGGVVHLLVEARAPAPPLSVTVPTWISVSVTPVAVAPEASPSWHTVSRSPKPPFGRARWRSSASPPTPPWSVRLLGRRPGVARRRAAGAVATSRRCEHRGAGSGVLHVGSPLGAGLCGDAAWCDRAGGGAYSSTSDGLGRQAGAEAAAATGSPRRGSARGPWPTGSSGGSGSRGRRRCRRAGAGRRGRRAGRRRPPRTWRSSARRRRRGPRPAATRPAAR